MGISFSPSRRRFVFAAAAQTVFSSSLVLGLVSGAWAQRPGGGPTASFVATAEAFYNGPRYVPGEVLVGVAPSYAAVPQRSTGSPRFAETFASASATTTAARQQIESIASAVTLSESPQLGLMRLRVNSGETVEQAIVRLKASGKVSYAEPNYIRHAFSTPNDPLYTTNQWGPKKIQADFAWDIWLPQAQTVIAIIDTGVTLNHPDLVNKIYKDSNGNVIGYNFYSNTTNPADDHGHGTHCAGIAAAESNNGIGIAGMAGWTGAAGSDTTNTKIMPLKVLGANGSGSDAGVASAIVWAADHGARVISMSLGGANSSQTLNNAVTYAINHNVVVVAAAGNDHSSALSYPGACPGVMSVASTGTGDVLSSFSNFGSWVTVAAPGEGIRSTYLNNTYEDLSGTSMATPHVAGEAALLASQTPSLSEAQLFSLIQNNTDPVVAPTGDTRTISGGRVNAYKALNAGTLWPPTSLTVVAASRATVNLTWADNCAIEDGFAVEVSSDGVNFTRVGTVGLNKTSTTVSGLMRSTTYTFRLRAVAGTTSGAVSATVQAKTKAL